MGLDRDRHERRFGHRRREPDGGGEQVDPVVVAPRQSVHCRVGGALQKLRGGELSRQGLKALDGQFRLSVIDDHH